MLLKEALGKWHSHPSNCSRKTIGSYKSTIQKIVLSSEFDVIVGIPWIKLKKMLKSLKVTNWIKYLKITNQVNKHKNWWSLKLVLKLIEVLGPIPGTIRSLWKSDRITNFSSAHDFSIRSDSTNDPASIGSWSWAILLATRIGVGSEISSQQLVILSVISP